MQDSRPHRTPLRIHVAPFKSSFLAIPPSPFSPRTPLTPVGPLRRSSVSSTSSSSYSDSDLSSPAQTFTATYVPVPPTRPLSWQWTCHQCAHSYPLSATRRCLDDGHRFCSGTTTIKSWRKPIGSRRVKNHQACASEFDYSGWKAWMRWRRDIHAEVKPRQQAAGRKDCWNSCSYPSECRWGKRYGVHTPVEPVFPSTDLSDVSTAHASPPFVQTADLKPTLNRSMDFTPTPIPLKVNELATSSRTSKDTRFWASLLASAERRKAGTTHIASPLSVVVEDVYEESSLHRSSTYKGRDGDTILSYSDMDLAILTPALNITPTTNLSSMRASPNPLPSTEPHASPTMLRALWARNKKTASTPLRYRRRSSLSSKNKSGRIKRSNGTGDAGLERANEGVFELEEFGVFLERVGSRDSGYGSCV